MSRSTTGSEQYDADKQFGAAIKALQEAAWRLRLASNAVDELMASLPPGTSIPSPYEGGAVVATADVLTDQIDALSTQTRRLRKRARNI